MTAFKGGARRREKYRKLFDRMEDVAIIRNKKQRLAKLSRTPQAGERNEVGPGKKRTDSEGRDKLSYAM